MSNHKYHHHHKLSIKEGMKLIGDHIDDPEKAFRVPVGGYESHVTSLRLRTFYKTGSECYLCGAKATHFSLDTFKNQSNNVIPHMNMWGVKEDGEPLLFTHDHKVAKSKGGKDNLNNTVTCCEECNRQKADMSVDELIQKRIELRSNAWGALPSLDTFKALLLHAIEQFPEGNPSRMFYQRELEQLERALVIAKGGFIKV